MTRSEQEMYRNIERIAVALETIVIQGKNQKLAQFKKATNLIYGNDNKGRSSDNYQYPDKGTTNIQAEDMYSGIHTPNDAPAFQHPTDIPVNQYPDKQTDKSIRKDGLTGYQPNITNQMDDRIYQESQAVTGGFFQTWYHALTPEELTSYGRVYGR